MGVGRKGKTPGGARLNRPGGRRGSGSGGGAGRARFVVKCGQVSRARANAIAEALVEAKPVPLFVETIKEQARRELLEGVSRDGSAYELKTRAAMDHAKKTGESVDVNSVNLIHATAGRPGVARLDLDDAAFAELLEGYEASPAVKAAIQVERARAIMARARGLQKLLRKLAKPNPSAYVLAEAKRRGLLA